MGYPGLTRAVHGGIFLKSCTDAGCDILKGQMTLERFMFHIPYWLFNRMWYMAPILWFIWSLRIVYVCRCSTCSKLWAASQKSLVPRLTCRGDFNKGPVPQSKLQTDCTLVYLCMSVCIYIYVDKTVICSCMYVCF